MAHFAEPSRKRQRVYMGLMLAAAAILIIFGTMWAGTQINEYGARPDGSTPPASTSAAAPATFTPAPTEVIPTCGPGEVWSNHASKCYIPEGSTRIDAIPTEMNCPVEWRTTAGDGCNEPDIGTIIEGPNGETCKVVDDKGRMSCNLPNKKGDAPPSSVD
jgi:hypothetical protein